MIGELDEDRRRSATACAATWRCSCCPTCSSAPGACRRRALLADGDRSACASSIPASASWPRSTGTWNGRCSSRASTTPTTSGSTTACARATPGRCASTSTPGSTTRTSWPASWRTTTSRGRRRRSRPDVHEAAAVITFLSPGLRFFHQGQFEGRTEAHLAASGPRRRTSRSTQRLQQFYDRLLAVLRQPVVRDGEWQLLECAPAWDGNWTYDCFVAFAWQGARRRAAARRRQLRRQPEPVPRPAAVRRPRRAHGAAARI